MSVSLKAMHKVYVLLTKIDYHPNDGGMRLTYATLGAYLKYPWLSKTIAEQGNRPANQRDKFGCYQAEKEILKQIAEQLGLIQLGDYHYCRHPLTYLLEAADDICYALIDLEDGIILNMLSYEEVEPIFLNLIGDYGIPAELAMARYHMATKNCRFAWSGHEAFGR